MLTKCMNSGCLATFRYLHEGRLFKLERGGSPDQTDWSFFPKTEFFWLCGRCERTLTVVIMGDNPVVRPSHLELPSGDVPGESSPMAVK